MKTNLKKATKNVRFRIYPTHFFIILTLNMCFVFGQKKTIVIDPGHGGMDSGAIGINHVLEKDVVLKVEQEILRLNKTLFDNRFDIFLTRYGDTLVSLSDRSRLAKGLNADVFISLHCNSSNATSRGIEVFVHDSNSPKTKASIELGVYILNECYQKLGFENRGVKFANFQVLRETTFCPSVLVEMGFLTSADEAGYFLETKNVRAMALGIIMGLYNYFNIGL